MNIHQVISFTIHILILILLISFFINNRNNRKNLIFILCSTIIYICYLIEFVRKPNIMNIKLDEEKEYFNANLNYQMGPYSNIKLENDKYFKKHNPKYEKQNKDSACSWRKKPCDVKLHSDIKFVAPVGIEKRYIEDPDHSKSFPTIDGLKDSKKSMFMFTHNQCHPDCCPSTYSCDKGCVCTTEQQRKLINQRGYNRNHVINPDI